MCGDVNITVFSQNKLRSSRLTIISIWLKKKKKLKSSLYSQIRDQKENTSVTAAACEGRGESLALISRAGGRRALCSACPGVHRFSRSLVENRLSKQRLEEGRPLGKLGTIPEKEGVGLVQRFPTSALLLAF